MSDSRELAVDRFADMLLNLSAARRRVCEQSDLLAEQVRLLGEQIAVLQEAVARLEQRPG